MRLLTAVYAMAIFLSAFLLFLIEPMMGKRLVPLLGGSAAVWTTCLVFFQFALLAGYLYAHRLVMRLIPRRQGMMHIGLLAAALALFSVGSRTTIHASTTSPITSVFWLLGFLIGAPFLALSATSPLLQAWYAASFSREGKPAAPPYHLFSLSNLGSLLALLAYPVLIEPRFSLHTQTIAWTTAFAIFVLACCGIAWKHRQTSAAVACVAGRSPEDLSSEELSTEELAREENGPPWRHKVLWLLFAACGSLLLCAVTNHITQNIAAIPLLWILPLIMYLLSFVLIFNPWGFYPRRTLLILLALVLAAAAHTLMDNYANPDFIVGVSLFCALLLLACLFCHGEVYRLRPAPRYATSFYLYIAAGGALGAICVGVIAPAIFSANYEFVCGLILLAALAFAVTWGKEMSPWGTVAVAVVCMEAVFVWFLRRKIPPKHHLPLLAFLALILMLAIVVTWIRGVWQSAFWAGATVFMIVLLFIQAKNYAEDLVMQTRSFYGVLRVTDEPDLDGTPVRHLYNGTIEHGKQFSDADLHDTPTTYYAEDSGIGLALNYCCGDRPRRVGVIGLGAGTIAAYGRQGDVFRFYDINPQVEKIARTKFTYLADSKAEIQVTLGDARMSLAGEPPQNFDVIAIDAFSGDAIPVHLLTTQAIELYQRHLRRGGILAFHISNRYLDLAPVVRQEADYAHMDYAEIDNSDNDDLGEYASDWVLLTTDEEFLRRPEVADHGYEIKVPPRLRLWTDDYNSLLPILRMRGGDE